MKIISVVGARPNFMKIAPFIRAINEYNERAQVGDPDRAKQASWGAGQREHIDHVLVHTGQHYDDRMSKAFFEDLNLPEADINLGIGSGSHAEQVGRTMIEFEKVLHREKPDWVVVVGDVNATLACSVTAKKENIRCCHIEAGLRSGDMTMPEEINRIVTDRLSDLLLVPDRFSLANLKAEGVQDSRIRFVGNIMIDTLDRYFGKASQLNINHIIERNLYTEITAPVTSHSSPGSRRPAPGSHCIITLHRPSNVDDKERLTALTEFLLNEVSIRIPVIWPVHPRTALRLTEAGLLNKLFADKNIILLQPLGYLEMLKLNMEAGIMITDSGGLQEECTVLGTPFLTLRRNTERPVTLSENGGSGKLTGDDINKLRIEFIDTLGRQRNPVRPALWDGNTAWRSLESLIEYS